MFRLDTHPSLWTAARPRGGAWLADDLTAWRSASVAHVVCCLTDPELAELDLTEEATRCRALGLRFTHLPIPDRTVPASARRVHTALAEARADRAAGLGVLTHCRQGIGRASLTAGALLVAEGAESADVWARIAAARGRSVPDTAEQRAWLSQYAAWCSLG